MTDAAILRQCLNLAKKGMGWVTPNPMVGAILVKDQKIIGKGYHRCVGWPHAEIEALKACKDNPKGATLYINLEPCVHYGRTPPCVGAIIQADISKVVCSSADPNPKVSGQGIAALKQVGIEVKVGELERQAWELNEAFFTFHTKKRPFVAIKFAASLDGKLDTSTGDSKWITNEKSRKYARSLRSQYQAVLVGINTVLKDDPHLSVRKRRFKNPMRIILDSKLRIPLEAKVFRNQQVLIITTSNANQSKLKQLKKMGFEIITLGKKIEIPKLMRVLYQREIISVLVEGGRTVLDSFIESKLVDKVYAFHAPMIIGEAKTLKQAIRLSNIAFKNFDNDLLTVGNIRLLRFGRLLGQ